MEDSAEFFQNRLEGRVNDLEREQRRAEDASMRRFENVEDSLETVRLSFGSARDFHDTKIADLQRRLDRAERDVHVMAKCWTELMCRPAGQTLGGYFHYLSDPAWGLPTREAEDWLGDESRWPAVDQPGEEGEAV